MKTRPFEVCRFGPQRAIIFTYQFPAAKKSFTWDRGHLCQTLKSYGIAIDNRGTSQIPREKRSKQYAFSFVERKNVRQSGKRVITKKLKKYTGRFQLSLKFRFAFPEISSGEWNNIFARSAFHWTKLSKRGQMLQKFAWKVSGNPKNFVFQKLEPFNQNFRKFRKENEIEWKFLVRNSRKLSIPHEPVLYSVFSRGYSCVFYTR